MIQGITNINSYLNNVKMQTIWNLNKQDPEKARIEKERRQQEIAKKIADIRSKLKFGKKLSDKELRLLKEHAPDLYKKAEAVQQERKNFKEQLKNCKTKEDVQRLFSQKMQFAMSMEKTDQEMTEYLTSAFQDEHATFTASDDYKNMKWEVEQTTEVSQKKKTTKNVDEIYQEVLNRAEKLTCHFDGLEDSVKKEVISSTTLESKTNSPTFDNYQTSSKEKKSTFTKKA